MEIICYTFLIFSKHTLIICYTYLHTHFSDFYTILRLKFTKDECFNFLRIDYTDKNSQKFITHDANVENSLLIVIESYIIKI